MGLYVLADLKNISYAQVDTAPSCEYKSYDESNDDDSQLEAVPSCKYKIFLGKRAKNRIKSLFGSGFIKCRAISVNLD